MIDVDCSVILGVETKVQTSDCSLFHSTSTYVGVMAIDPLVTVKSKIIINMKYMTVTAYIHCSCR